jgi:nucleoside-diphosphate-sugar epimerase
VNPREVAPSSSNQAWPERVESEEQLEELLTRPSPALIEFVRTLPNPLLILGAGGKMGPTLAILAKRAAEAANHPLEVIGVSRFGEGNLASRLNSAGVQTISCDLLQEGPLRRLPEAANLVYLVGLKFGTAQNPSATWAINTIVPTRVAERYRNARIVALSTGNVYPLSEVQHGGSLETDALAPLGEYANAAVARERLFEFHSRSNQTPIALLRLFYAVELRYGVLVDIARRVFEGTSIDLGNGYFNCIWQGDANELALRALSLAASPPTAWNLCQPEVYSVRSVASQLGAMLDRPVRFVGRESATALLGNARLLCSQLGTTPGMPLETMLSWIAQWVKRGGRNLGKPTHFESRDGRY